VAFITEWIPIILAYRIDPMMYLYYYKTIIVFLLLNSFGGVSLVHDVLLLDT
jgi:hypothetical protein